jgi:amidase
MSFLRLDKRVDKRVDKRGAKLKTSGIALSLALLFAPLADAATLNITSASISDVQAAYATGKLTSAKLTAAYIARINAYNAKGPAINAVIMMNPKAMAEAKAMDAERRAGKVRGPLHGVPIVLKDNYNTFDMQTTAGSQLLKGSIPPDDATVVKKLREAGAVIVAKVNLNEFAGSGGMVNGAKDPEVVKAGRAPAGFSSMGLQTRNPHDPTRVPSSSSGGTGASIAAGFAQFGTGTDTGGSIRGPATVNGVVGLKTTYGLVSRAGIVPLALSLDTAGPIARNVTDIAYALGAIAGSDPADPATAPAADHAEKDYTKYLKTGSLKGVRIGITPEFMGGDEGTKKIAAAAVETLKKLGAEIVEPVVFPEYLLAARGGIYELLVNSEFKAQITEYLHTLKPGFPRSFDEVTAMANDPKTGYRSPEKAYALKYSGARALDLTDPIYLNLKNQMMPTFKDGIAAVFVKYKIDALFFPTNARPASLIAEAPKPITGDAGASPGNMTNESGFPEIVIPAGLTDEGLPVGMSFLGPAWSDPKLISYGYDFEQATKAIHLPKFTPALPSDTIKY